MPGHDEVSYDADTLNSAWDELVLGAGSQGGRRHGDQEWSQTMRAVQRHAGTIAGPDVQFGRALRQQLLDPPAAGTRLELVAAPTPIRAAKRMRMPRRRHERAWRGWVELTAVAAILLAIFGRFAPLGPEAGDQQGVAPFVATPATASTENGFFRGTLGRTGEYGSEGLGEEISPRWEQALPYASMPLGEVNRGGGNGSGLPVVADDMIYLASRGDILALDPATGETIWTHAGVNIDSAMAIKPIVGPAVADGVVVYASVSSGSRSFGLIAVNAGTGESRWSQLVSMDEESILGWVVSSPLIVNDSIYVVAESGESASVPAYADGRIFAGSGLPTARLMAFDLATGTEQWRVPASQLAAYDAVDGRRIWHSQSHASSVMVGDGRLHVVVAVGEGKGILTVDAASGDELWRVENPDPTTLPLAVSNGMVVALGTDQLGPEPSVGAARIRAFDAATGAEGASIELGQVVFASVSAPVVSDDMVYLTADVPGASVALIRAGLGDDEQAEYLSVPAELYSPVDVTIAAGLLLVRGDSLVAYGAAGENGSPPAETFEPLPRDIDCDVAERSGEPPYYFPGPPAATLDGIYSGNPERDQGLLPIISADDVILAPTVSSEDERAVGATLAWVQSCQVLQAPKRLLALFSDDFFRRPDQISWVETVHTTLQVVELGELPDGRIGARVNDASGGSTLVVFVEQDGAWLIDEVARIR